MAHQKADGNGISDQTGQKTIADFDPPKRPRKNVYAIACAVLASTASILLGYGQYIYILPVFLLIYIYIYTYVLVFWTIYVVWHGISTFI